jgi:dihydropyrimidine dehydrogenase (NAD+) subunit PreT
MHGHDVVLLTRRPKAGGLNEYGIASYKAPGGFAQAEVDWLLQIGGIEIRTLASWGDGLTLERLTAEYDAVFLGIGLAGVNALRAEGEDKDGVRDAVDFIAELRQASDLSTLPVGRERGGHRRRHDGGGRGRAVEASGRRERHHRLPPGPEKMSASAPTSRTMRPRRGADHPQRRPVAVHGNGAAVEVEFAYTREGPAG